MGRLPCEVFTFISFYDIEFSIEQTDRGHPMQIQTNRFAVTVAGAKKVLTVISAKPDAGALPPRAIHHVDIADRSGSMYGSIEELADQMWLKVQKLGDDDLYSLLWFSSPGQFRTVIKGAKKSDGLKGLIDSLRSVLGVTCFSEVLVETETIVSELSSLCGDFSITLFTDGQPVVPWGAAEEERRCLEIAGRLAATGKVLAFNTIGYGNYYNREFLTKLAQTSQYGVMVHSKNIEQYLAIHEENTDRIAGMVREPLNVLAGAGAEIVHITPKSSKLVSDELHIDRIDPESNFVCILTDSPTDVVVNGELVSVDSKSKASDHGELVEDFFYSLAYGLYYDGRRQLALDIVAKNLKDRALVDQQINAFTYDEVADYISSLKDAVFDRSKRFSGGKCPPGYVPKADATCVMDVLQILAGGDNYYAPYSKNVDAYKRIGRKVTDEFDLFTRGPDEVLSSVGELVFNKDKMNVSVRFVVKGTVDLNPKAAKRVGLPEKVDAIIYRNHTFVKDGQLNIKQAEFQLDDITADTLRGLKVPMKEVGTGRFVINLSKLPIINRTYVDKAMNVDSIFDTVKKITQLEAATTVLNGIRETLDSQANIPSTLRHSTLTPEQLQVLQDHGISKDYVYGGVQNSVAKVEDSDFYEVRELKFSFAGFSSMPGYGKLMETISSGKKLNGPGTEMAKFLTWLRGDAVLANSGIDLDKPIQPTMDFLDRHRKNNKLELMKARATMNILKMATVLTGGWWPEFQADDKGEFSYERDGMVLKAKANRVKVYIDKNE